MKDNFYCLVMFPYPSGEKLHMGHWYNYAPIDTFCRYKRMKNKDVFQPMGFDSFGLPAENNAIKTGVHPRDSIDANIAGMMDQMWEMEAEYDLLDPLITSDPAYYRWTQWIFLQLYKNDLAYKSEALVNYCPSCKTTLANEQVIDNKCERCEAYVQQVSTPSWFFKTTEYAKELYEGLSEVDWPKDTIKMQRNWIGDDYKNLRDWNISRQRYWGCPIPIVYDPDGKPHPVPDDMLPWRLPIDVEFEPSGASPLAASEEFINRTERAFGRGWRPEFDTMDTFVDSSFYFIRYLMDSDSDKFVDKKHIRDWLPVDLYVGGKEHACLHLLYARFINMVLHDLDYSTVREPFKRLAHQGFITYNGKKMSKSKGNTVDPSPIVETYGADALRLYLMNIGPYDQGGEWDDNGINGMARFLNRVRNADKIASAHVEHHHIDKTINKVEDSIEKLKFNVAIGELMRCLNEITALKEIPKTTMNNYIKIMYPFAPMLAQELRGPEIIMAEWPVYINNNVRNDLVVQIDGKFVGTVKPKKDKEYNINAAKSIAQLEDSDIVNIIYVEDRIVNFVTRKKDK